MSKTRIQVYADEEIKRRVEQAAAQQDVTVTEYCLAAIQQRLEIDEHFHIEQTDADGTFDQDWPARAKKLRERILARRGGKYIDLDIIERVRSERDDELLNLR